MMNKIKLTITGILLAIIIPISSARPARRGPIELKQPDGSIFMASFKGDEWGRIKTTIDGHAIIQEQDGWWCYATYDPSGAKSSTGHRVGKETPAEVMGRSLYIPGAAITANAAKRRAVATGRSYSEPLLTRISRSNGIMTRTDAGQESVIKHAIVILAEYKDVKFDNKKEAFVNLLTQEGYNLNGATGSAKEYFDDQFNGMVEFSFDVSDIVTLSQDRAYYGGNDSDDNDLRPAEMIAEACSLAFVAGVDFTRYDDDKDGEVDNVFVFFAGGDEAEGAGDDCIWSHAWYLIDGAGIRPSEVTFDGMRVNRYACTAELTRTRTGDRLAGIGTFCHEYSHTFDLPDFYDTDYEEEGGWAAGLWISTALMDGGNSNNNGNTPPYYNAIERELLGLSQPVLMEKGNRYVLEPIHKNGVYYRLDTDRNAEYYLFECRSNEKWDRYIGGKGLLVYHIDKVGERIKKWVLSNDLNAVQTHQCADLIEADGRKDGFADESEFVNLTYNISGIFYPYKDVTSLTPDSKPALTYWSGMTSDLAITGIKWDGDNIVLNVVDSQDAMNPPTVNNYSCTAFPDGALITFEASRVFKGEAYVTWSQDGKEDNTVVVEPYQSGKYMLKLEGLKSGKTHHVAIHFESNGAIGKTLSDSFLTKKLPAVSWPYMYITDISDIPLHIVNAADAAEIKWTFDGKEVNTQSGWFKAKTNGTLKATVYWEDGSSDIITKEINIGQ